MTRDLADAYDDAVLELWLPIDGHIVVTAAPPGRTEGSFPEGVHSIHVLTAHNPRSRLLPPAANADRNRRLGHDLRRLGVVAHPALGRSPDGRWSEDSVAIVDGDEERLLALASTYEQHAIYRWTPSARQVLWTDGQLGRELGWSCSDSGPPTQT
jgi:hypothetical protein